MSNSINICIFNAQSFNNKCFSIYQYIKENEIDIMCLNETFLHKDINNVNLLNNFSMLRQDREKRGGGVAIIIHKRLKHRILKSKSTLDYEYIAIEICSANEKVTLLNAYTHPKSKTKYNFIENIMKLTSNKIICVGDLNATNIAWFCMSSNNRGKELEKLCSENNLIIANNDTPTSRKSTNIIDMIICSDRLINRIEDLKVDTTFDVSDHWPVRFKLEFTPGASSIDKINWTKFQEEMDSSICNKVTNINSTDDLEIEAQFIGDHIKSVISNNTVKVEVKSHDLKVPKDILSLIKYKKKLMRLYSSTHDQVIKNIVNNIANKIKRCTKRLSNEKWNDQCAFLALKKPSEQVYWKILKQIETGNQPKDPTILPNTESPKEKADIMANFYENIFQNNYFDRNFENIFDPGEQEYPMISVNETVEAIKSTKSTNSTGVDGISFKILKSLPLSAIKHITLLFNKSLLFRYVPYCWKVAKIKVLKKKEEDLDNPGSYRPISLLVTISRVLEKIVNSRINKWAESNNIIHMNQSGFRKYHSCQDNIFKMIETCRVGLQKGLKSGKIDFDVEKAFDKCPHKGILLTLKEYGCPNYIGNWLTSFFEERKFIVEIDGESSTQRDILAGVPQGSPLSPLLFSLYINEIGKILERHQIHFGLFADDLTIWKIHEKLSEIELVLQKAIDDINRFFNNKGLKLNGKKCIYTIFTSKPKDRIKLYISEQEIEYQENPKSLGIFFDSKLKFNFHFQEIKKQLVTKINLLRILSNRSNRINVDHLFTIYRSLILSKIQYSMLPFLVTTNKIKKEIQSIQNKCLKIILNLPSHTSSKLTHQTMKCEKLDKRFSILTCNFLTNARENNPSFKQIFEDHINKDVIFTKSKRSILDRINTITLTPQLSTTQYF